MTVAELVSALAGHDQNQQITTWVDDGGVLKIDRVELGGYVDATGSFHRAVALLANHQVKASEVPAKPHNP